MSTPVYKPVTDGVYHHNGSVISVDAAQSCLSISEKKARMRIWVGELPTNWRLCEAVEYADRLSGQSITDDANALAVPLDDIERLLRAAEPVLHPTRDGRLLMRRVQRWLDTLPRESQAPNARPPTL